MKERIYQSAITEIMQRGLRFSIRDLASRLGISTKTLYVYFDSKEKIINYIVERSIQEMKEKEQEIMEDPTLSMKEKLHLSLVNIPQGVAFSNIHLLDDLHKMYPNQWAIVDEHLNRGWDGIRLLIAEGIANKELREFDVDLFIRVYVGAMYHLMDNEVSVNQHLSLEQALSGTVDLLLSGIYNQDV